MRRTRIVSNAEPKYWRLNQFRLKPEWILIHQVLEVFFSHFRTYEECLTVRKHVNGPFILDENISDIQTIAKAWQDHAADVVNIKISKFGGITRAKQATEFCSSVGIAMTVEDTWGGNGCIFTDISKEIATI